MRNPRRGYLRGAEDGFQFENFESTNSSEVRLISRKSEVSLVSLTKSKSHFSPIEGAVAFLKGSI